MNPTGLIGIAGFVLALIVALLLVIFTFIHQRSPFYFRNIRAFMNIRRAASLVVEDGTRLHISVGSANVLTPAAGSSLAGLALVRHLGQLTSLSDHPPVTSTGSATLNLLAQDTLRTAHESVATDQAFEMNNARLTGLTPLSYTAGVIPLLRDEKISTNVIIGNLGPEIALLTDAAERQNTPAIAASDSLPAQSVLFAVVNEPLIGEELFAAGAYTQAGPSHSASLLVQDILRWLVIVGLFGGALLKALGIL